MMTTFDACSVNSRRCGDPGTPATGQRSPIRRWLEGAILSQVPSLIALVAISANAQNQPLVFQSAATRTALLELFTSEGCSSCPPAETWLTSLTAAAGLWKDFVPVAFHVDYWDYLGWRAA